MLSFRFSALGCCRATSYVEIKEESLSQQSGRLGWGLLQYKRASLGKLTFTRVLKLQCSMNVMYDIPSKIIRSQKMLLFHSNAHINNRRSIEIDFS